MHDGMTLSSLINMGSSDFIKKEANWLIVKVQAFDNEPEIIINPKANFDFKLHYFSQTYNEDLTLKNNPNIKIIDYDFVATLLDWL